MKAIKDIMVVLVIILITFSAAFAYGWLKGRKSAKKNEPVITSRIILDKIVEQSFLVTKTLFLDTKAEIVISDPSGWRGFFLGQKISAQGIVRTDIGSDLKKMKPEDIVIDEKNRSVSVYLPAAEILDSSLYGNVEIESKKGVWTNIKDFFTKEEGDDYNRAVNELVAQANAAAKSKEDVFREVDSGAGSFVIFIISQLLPGYSVQVGQK